SCPFSFALSLLPPHLTRTALLPYTTHFQPNSEPDARLLRLPRPAADPLLREDVNPKFDVALPAHCSRIQPIRHGAQKAPWLKAEKSPGLPFHPQAELMVTPVAH